MPSEAVVVRHVRGRYPNRPAVLRSENIEATVTEIARVYRVRIDDLEHPEMWLEIVLEVETGSAEEEIAAKAGAGDATGGGAGAAA